jgi:hypothetical protein
MHPDLAYWVEPRHVWAWGNSYRPDDVLTESDARPRVVRHIRGVFGRFVRDSGKLRLAEKTPSNCLRVRFINAVYPEAKIIIIVRDGRSVLRSTDELMQRGVPTGKVISRALQTPLWEWPAYAGRTFSTIVRKATGKGLQYWGPRPPGWREWAKRDPREVVLAKQWAATISTALEHASAIPATSWLKVRYETLMHEPRRVMQEVVDFAELPSAEGILRHVEQTADPARIEKWRTQLDADLLERVRPHMEPTLVSLGYQW